MSARVGLIALLGVVIGGTGCWRTDVYPLSRRPSGDGSSDVAAAGGGDSVGWALYVAPDGNDANPGTLTQPLRTLAKARDVVRTRNGAMTADIGVYLRGGTYPQTSPLTFANADAGSGGFYVKYMAYPGERPLITGGQPIKGWKVADASNSSREAISRRKSRAHCERPWRTMDATWIWCIA